ncbi:hypothetical protein cmbei_1003430 [Cryptosporidium meleagridis]
MMNMLVNILKSTAKCLISIYSFLHFLKILFGFLQLFFFLMKFPLIVCALRVNICISKNKSQTAFPARRLP